MKIAILKERRAAEARVAASPETVKKLTALGAEVALEKGAGAGASFSDEAYQEAGASIAKDAAAAAEGAEVVLKVQYPEIARLARVDLKSLGRVGTLVSLVQRKLDLRSIVREVARLIALEIDFVREARSTDRIRATLEGHLLRHGDADLPGRTGERSLVRDRLVDLARREGDHELRDDVVQAQKERRRGVGHGQEEIDPLLTDGLSNRLAVGVGSVGGSGRQCRPGREAGRGGERLPPGRGDDHFVARVTD